MRAFSEFEAIHDYISAHSAQNAPTMSSRILGAIDSLKTFPNRGSIKGNPRKERYPVRSITEFPYIIYFRVLDDQDVVRVVRIRHGARRQPRKFDH